MMTTKIAERPRGRDRRENLRKARERQRRNRRWIRLVAWTAGLAVVGAIVTAMLLSARPTSSVHARPAPDFTLTDTSGRQVSLSDLRGRNVLLYPNEGAGCDACFYQMADIEKNAAAFERAGVTVLPIVMNPAEQVVPELARFKLRTPYLIDSGGKVSKAYGTLGKGMHAGLPGHGFILIDGDGVQRWYGEYPSMFLSSADLLTQVRKHLAT